MYEYEQGRYLADMTKNQRTKKNFVFRQTANVESNPNPNRTFISEKFHATALSDADHVGK